MLNKIGSKAKILRSGKNGRCTNVTYHRHHVGLPMIDILRWHFQPPEAPQDLNDELTSYFATPRSSHLFLGRNVDQTRESGGNQAYNPVHFFFFSIICTLTTHLYSTNLCLILLQCCNTSCFPCSLNKTHFNYLLFLRLQWNRDGAVVRAFASHQCVPGFDSRARRHMWVEFVVGSLLCSERFLDPGPPVFPSPQKPTFPNSNSIWNCQALIMSLWLGWLCKHSLCLTLNLIYIYITLHLKKVVNSILCELSLWHITSIYLACSYQIW